MYGGRHPLRPQPLCPLYETVDDWPSGPIIDSYPIALDATIRRPIHGIIERTFDANYDPGIMQDIFAGDISASYASKFVLHPDLEIWDSAVRQNEKTVAQLPSTCHLGHVCHDCPIYEHAANLDKRYEIRLGNAPHSGYKTISNLTPPPDAKQDIISVGMTRRSKSCQGGSINKATTTKVNKDIIIPRLRPDRHHYRPNFRHYIQHTLPTENCNVGLHTAILQDALDRSDFKDAQLKNGRKRSAHHLDDEETPSSKRFKSNPLAKTDPSETSNEIAKRKLALVKLHYGVYCSPAPSAFVRVGPSCAVGIVHPAVVKLTMESGDILQHNLVIKLAFSPKQQEKLLDEYNIYVHLSQKKVIEGIVTVHGMFRDPDSGALGMLMDDAGQSLYCRERERSGNVDVISTISATEEERDAFMRTLKSLHDAGVRHNDIHAENLLINSRNEVFIVDFDRACLEVDDVENMLELQVMNKIFQS
ncbi:hypothetical protein CPB84DRAFT_1744536 [Gymnopilus junonius]|uniref:Protein kinase domain-containing protein n=1 Tax=Gymnopilus junonius TaxID=109634 RepID=A0A9P5NV83_GYMJU|nr:hypothetical protein CPB84DRAFT_1744536 [Gymnopilus junonius]